MNNEGKDLNVNFNDRKNISTGNIGVSIEELTVNGVTLKGLHAEYAMTITDQNVAVQCDFVGKLLNQLIAKFGDHITNLLNKEADMQDVRIEARRQDAEDEHKRHEAEIKRINAETAKFEAEIDQIRNGYKKTNKKEE